MNILGSLIPIDQGKAIQFTREFSKLYRKVLELKDEVVISLAEELEFITSYVHLQKVRFEESLNISINIDTIVYSKTLPPFALQMTIENAIKHNTTSIIHPLQIEISNTQDSIVIKNNLQLRSSIQYPVSSIQYPVSSIQYPVSSIQYPVFNRYRSF